MAYYEERYHYSPRDRHARPSSVYSHDYYDGDGPYTGSRHESGAVRRHNGSADSLSGYEYGYGLPPQPRHSRVATVQEGVHKSHPSGGRGSYYDEPDYHRSRHSRRSKHHDYDDPRDRHRRSERSPSGSRSPPPHRRRKSFSEQAMGALGLGSVASSDSRRREHSRGRSHGKSYSYSPSPTRSRSRHHRDRSEQRIAQAVKAALTAGAVEAFRVRKEPGEWSGEKGKRILTAALTAGGTDGLVDRDPNKHAKRHIIESTLAGLAANHLVNGPRSRSRSKSRGREKSRSRVPDIAAAGALAAAGKEAYQRFRSKSRNRGRSPSPDSYDGSPRRPRRSRSVSDYVNRGMEALGLEDKKGKKDKDKDDRRRHRDRPSRYDDYSDSGSDSDYEPRDHRSSRRVRHSRDVGRPLHPKSGAKGEEGRAYPQGCDSCDSHSDEDSDLGSSTDEEHQQKKLTRKALVATGLATVATIHAMHELHGNLEKHKDRVKSVKQGDISPEEARKRRFKNNAYDAANVGLMTLGVKGALDGWRHVNQVRKERANYQKECSSKRQRRHRRAQSYDSIPHHRTVYPDEIEEYLPSETGSRGRAMSMKEV
ncbi:hypothetical protein BDV25DRAFT_160413 [Aspergillus avenaceus]|uniref:DUF3824 domain-containing protein n=1 Tax=Aspergillus avenaceus TaxID=36643 RepID=A0A5N6TM17_ASPAV|nr:hypothetical protein BDV25DRAFT_160413 [Aspergillus avenaceus]